MVDDRGGEACFAVTEVAGSVAVADASDVGGADWPMVADEDADGGAADRAAATSEAADADDTGAFSGSSMEAAPPTPGAIASLNLGGAQRRTTKPVDKATAAAAAVANVTSLPVEPRDEVGVVCPHAGTVPWGPGCSQSRRGSVRTGGPAERAVV